MYVEKLLLDTDAKPLDEFQVNSREFSSRGYNSSLVDVDFSSSAALRSPFKKISTILWWKFLRERGDKSIPIFLHDVFPLAPLIALSFPSGFSYRGFPIWFCWVGEAMAKCLVSVVSSWRWWQHKSYFCIISSTFFSGRASRRISRPLKTEKGW